MLYVFDSHVICENLCRFFGGLFGSFVFSHFSSIAGPCSGIWIKLIFDGMSPFTIQTRKHLHFRNVCHTQTTGHVPRPHTTHIVRKNNTTAWHWERGTISISWRKLDFNVEIVKIVQPHSTNKLLLVHIFCCPEVKYLSKVYWSRKNTLPFRSFQSVMKMLDLF